jgi:hypothetical protein
MSELFSTLHDAKVPVQYLQLDPYWYKCCNGGWEPDPNLYGAAGLRGLMNGLDPTNTTKLLLYHTYWSRYTESVYKQLAPGANFSFVAGYNFLNWGKPRSIFQASDPPHLPFL